MDSDALVGEINAFLDGIQEYSAENLARIRAYLAEVRRRGWKNPMAFLPRLGPPDEEDWDAPKQLARILYSLRLRRHTYRRLRVALHSHLLYPRGFGFARFLPLGGDYLVKASIGGRYSLYAYRRALFRLRAVEVLLGEKSFLVEPWEAKLLRLRKRGPMIRDAARRIAVASAIGAEAYSRVRERLGIGEGRIADYNRWLAERGFLPDIEPEVVREMGLQVPFEVKPRTGLWKRELEEEVDRLLEEFNAGR